METLDELMKIINDIIDGKYWTTKNPKRCVLNEFLELSNVPGSLVEIYDRDNEKDLLFIADKSNEDYFHNGSDVFEKDYFSSRCLWVFENEVTLTPIGGFCI